MKRKEKGYAVYSEMGDGITKELRASHSDAFDLLKDVAMKNRMPYESGENALKRYHVVEVEVTYNVPK